MGRKSLAFVTMLDTSGSMRNAIDMLKIDAKAFTRQAWVKDQFAVVQFASNAKNVYPRGNNVTLSSVSSNLSETKKATEYIEDLKAGGTTAMGDAINMANGIMRRSRVKADLKAYVMFSDGWHNVGSDPVSALGNDIPIYIAALGSVDKRYFDLLIAKNPKSKFYNQPNAYDMMKMFNAITAEANECELLLNDKDNYNKGSDYIIKTFDVSAKDNSPQICVVWSNKGYKYTPNPPSGKGINIVLIDPNDNSTTHKPDIAEDGFCIYNLQNVQPGTWKVLIQYVISEGISGTVGSVDYYTDIKTNLLLPNSVKKGEKFEIGVSALCGTSNVEDAKVTAEISRPLVSMDEIEDVYGERLQMMKETTDADEAVQELAPMERLRSQILHEEHRDILAKDVVREKLELMDDGNYRIVMDDVQKTGVYNVNVRIEGINHKTGKRFTSVREGSVFIG